MRSAPRSGKRHVLRWVAVGAVVIVSAGTLAAYLKYRAVYDSITRVTVPGDRTGPAPAGLQPVLGEHPDLRR